MLLAADLRDRHSQLKLAIALSDQNDPPVDDSSSNQGHLVVSLVLESPATKALFELIEPDERRKMLASFDYPALQRDDRSLSISCRVVDGDLPSPPALNRRHVAEFDRTRVHLSHGQRTRRRRGCLGKRAGRGPYQRKEDDEPLHLISLGGSVHLQLPGRAARDFNFSGSLKGTVAVTLKVVASPLILTGSASHLSLCEGT
jgi:hypothetical protein